MSGKVNPVGDGGVMVLSTSSGAGHMRAADALVGAFETRGVNASHIDVLKYTNPVFRRFYSDLYLELVNRQPELLGWVYDALDKPWKYQKRRLALDRLNTGPFVKLIKKEMPAAVICTHFLPAEIMLYLKRKGEHDIPVGIVVTDMDAHAMWLYTGAKWYFVAHEETKVYLAALGIPEDIINVTGIPIDPVFSVERDKEETRKALGLNPKTENILISAGGFGVGPVESIVRAVDGVGADIQMTVICGRNASLKKRIESLKDLNHPLTVVGFTSEMHRWMAASGLIVGKAGGLTSSEAMASGLVMVIVNPVPGQEERNSDHFLEEGVAIRCNNLPTLSYKIDSLLSDGDRLAMMKENVRRMARPNAAADVVDVVKSIL